VSATDYHLSEDYEGEGGLGASPVLLLASNGKRTYGDSDDDDDDEVDDDIFDQEVRDSLAHYAQQAARKPHGYSTMSYVPVVNGATEGNSTTLNTLTAT